MGGHIAIRLAARKPTLVRRLVLVAPAIVAQYDRPRPFNDATLAFLAGEAVGSGP
jgi:pimeloyl-ACP methyl ester carboxylesterase